MRIIAGEARGRKLYAPVGEETRPTADRVRESLFNILGDRVSGARVLDLFGGTGALALEAVSRGASFALIADASARAVECIRRNARAVAGERFEERVRIVRADYRRAIERLGDAPRLEDAYDLIFLDPPYRLSDAYADALERLRDRGALKPGALILAERAKELAIRLPAGFSAVDVRAYGDSAVEFICEGERA